MKKTTLGLIIALTLAISCKKKDTPPQNNNTTTTGICYLKTLTADSLTIKFYYDNNNHIISGAIDDPSQPDSIVFKYDANGRIIGEVDLATPGDTNYYEVYDLNSNGKISVIHQFGSINNGVFEESEKDEWTYGANNRPSKISVYTSNNGTLSLSSVLEYAYDAKGNVSSITTYDAKNALQSTETFQYDDKKSAMHIDGNTSDPSSDNVNNITQDITKDASGTITDKITKTYQYDTEGYPVQETDTDMTGAPTTYSYTYNCK